MPIATPKNTDAKGDGLDEELEDGDIIVLDENGNKIRFKPVEFD